MTIIRPNSISGINSITAKNTDQMKLYDSNGDWSHVRAGVITATTFVGNLTGNVTGTASQLETNATGANLTLSGNLGVGGTITYEDVARVDATGISTFREGFGVGPLAGIALTAYKDGSIRTTGIITASTFSSDTNSIFTTGGTERVRIDSSGRLLLGTTTEGEASADNLTVADSAHAGITIRSGTTSYGSLFFSDATSGSDEYSGSIEYKHNDNFLILRTAATERLRITSDGKMGLGISNPTGQFAVSDGTRIAEINPHSSGTYIGNRSNHPILFQVNASEKMKIDTNGDVIIGTTSWSYPKPLNVQGSSGAILALSNYDTTSYAQDTMTSIELRLNTGNTGNQNGACEIRAVKENGTNGDNARSLSFWTAGNGGSPTERFRIYGSGETHHQGQKHTFRHDNSGGMGPYLSLQNRTAAAGSQTGISFGCDNSDAVLAGNDYGNAEIKVTNDGSGGGIMEFSVHHGSANFSALKIHGNAINQSSTNSVTNAFKGGVAFGCAGIAIDKSWDNYPGIHVFNTTGHSDTNQGQFRFHGWNRSYSSYVNSSGSDFSVTIVADGMSITSDERRKTEISTITNALDTVSKLRGVSFTMINRELEPQTHLSMDNGKKLGFIAQEVIPILPSAVMDSGDHVQPLENGYCDRYMMDYGAITPVLVEAIKELKNENAALRARVSALESS